MLVKRFKNGNFNVKIDGHESKHESTLVNLIWALNDYDCTLFGEEYCISNFGMGVDMYCYYTDMIVSIPYRVLEELEAGKTVKLYAHKLDTWEKEEFEKLRELEEI